MSASTLSSRPKPPADLSPDALLCCLVVAPGLFPRNRHYGLYENPGFRRARRRAYHVRSVLKQLLGTGSERAEILGRVELDDERVLIRYRVAGLNLQRTTAFTAMESSALNYALHQAGHIQRLAPSDRKRVQQALRTVEGLDLKEVLDATART